MVRKPKGGLRLCVDYKVTLNKYLKLNHYQIPLISEIYTKLAGSKIFSTIDLKSAYNQVPLDEESRNITVISTPIGLYKYNVLPFGLATAPSIFQRVMDTILADVPECVVYIDDIIVGAQDEADHKRILITVLYRLNSFGVRLAKDKGIWGEPTVKFLGHILFHDKIHRDPTKIAALRSCVAPRSRIFWE